LTTSSIFSDFLNTRGIIVQTNPEKRKYFTPAARVFFNSSGHNSLAALHAVSRRLGASERRMRNGKTRQTLCAPRESARKGGVGGAANRRNVGRVAYGQRRRR
jgi:hypothetical protein